MKHRRNTSKNWSNSSIYWAVRWPRVEMMWSTRRVIPVKLRWSSNLLINLTCRWGARQNKTKINNRNNRFKNKSPRRWVEWIYFWKKTLSWRERLFLKGRNTWTSSKHFRIWDKTWVRKKVRIVRKGNGILLDRASNNWMCRSRDSVPRVTCQHMKECRPIQICGSLRRTKCNKPF